MGRDIIIKKDIKGKRVAVINNIHFAGKRMVDWDNVKEYLKAFVGENHRVEDTDDIIYMTYTLTYGMISICFLSI